MKQILSGDFPFVLAAITVTEHAQWVSYYGDV